LGNIGRKRQFLGFRNYSFFKKENQKNIHIFEEECGMPLGPAAGPHTQLAQNIITAYLVGGRFF